MSTATATATTTSPLIQGRPRSRSFSSTPTFSSDLAKLRAVSSTPNCIVHSYQDAIAIASSFDVLTSRHSPLSRKLKLNSMQDWKDFLNQATGVVTVNDTATADADDDNNVSINLEKLLRHCFDIAYKMPPSPSNKIWKSHARSASSTNAAALAAGASGASAGGSADGRSGSPPSLQI